MTRVSSQVRIHGPLLAVVCLLSAWLTAQELPKGQLGPAPRVVGAIPEPVTPAIDQLQLALAPVDRTNRQAVVDYYNSVYLPALAVPNDWTGTVAGCNAGVTSAAYADATMDMVNYFRAMTGLPASVSRESVKDGKSQAAALMMSANNSLNHFPPTSWICYSTDGAEAAGKSNLALGAAGAEAVALYMYDPGASNTAVGHRRWILYPRQVEMGTGSTGNANVLWVLGVFGSRPLAPDIVTWPPSGFVPYQLMYPRWSFSVNTSASVSFSGATVSMTRGGQPVPLTMLPNAVGFGDNTVVWEPSGLPFGAGQADDPITVQVNGVTVGGLAGSYEYTVTVIDPLSAPFPTFTDTPLVPGATPVKAVHVRELRQAADALRSRHGLSGFAWTDPVLTPGATVVRAVHLEELRSALNAVYIAAGRALPTYTTTLVARSTAIAAVDVLELRTAVLSIWN